MMTKAQRQTLARAAQRERGNICPTPGYIGAAQTTLVQALVRRGWVTEGGIPYITAAGRRALQDEAASP